MVRVAGFRLVDPGSNPGSDFFSFFSHAKFLFFFAQTRHIRRRKRQICENLQTLIMRANLTHTVLT